MSSSEFYRNVYGSMAEGRYRYRHATVQRGNGFFGRVIRGSLLPIIKSVLPYLKDVALDGVGGLVNELKEGKSVKEASSNQLKRTTSNLMSDMARRIKNRQSGTGLRKRKRRKQTGSGVGKRKRQRKSGVRKRRTPRPSNRSVFRI